MNFLLQHLELHIDETSLLQGERLLEGERITYCAEQEKNLWVATVEAGHTYEIEVKTSPSRVTAATCECERFLETEMCGHIAAVLLQVRKLQQARKETARQNTPPRRIKLNAEMILGVAPTEDLLVFLREYAKQDRAFTLALKARFAGMVTGMGSQEKYVQIIESAISMARKPDRTLNKKGSQQLHGAVQELLAQAEDHCARGLYAEALNIAQAIIEKLPPVMNKAQGYEAPLRKMVEKAMELLHQLSEKALPPALREVLWHYCIEEFGRVTHRMHQFDDRFFKIMMVLSVGMRQQKQLLDWMEEHLERYAQEHRDPSNMVILQLQWAEKVSGKKAFFDMAGRYAHLQPVLQFVVERSLELNQSARARKVILNLLKTEKNREDAGEIEELLLRIALHEKDVPSVFLYARKRFLATLQDSYWQLLRTHTPENRLEVFEQIVESLRKLPSSPQKWQAIAGIYASEERYEDLIDYLRRANSIELLAQFDHLLLPRYEEEVGQLYRILLLQYLKNHIGYRPSKRIRELLDHLVTVGAPELAASLITLFKASYPERQSLMEELKLYGR